MRILLLATAALLNHPALAATPAERWMGHVKVLADDKMEGRLTGTPGYDRAAAYVAGEFQKLGLKPAGTDGFYQPVPLTEQTVDLKASRLELVHLLRARSEMLLLALVAVIAHEHCKMLTLCHCLFAR